MKNIFLRSDTGYFFNNIERLTELNPLAYYIFYKPKWYEFKDRYIIYKFKKFLENKYTPSYEFLCNIYDFICICENIYMWPNTEKSPIYAYRNLKPGVRSFKFTVETPFKEFNLIDNDKREADYTVEYTLYPNNQINLTLSRKWGAVIKTDILFEGGSDLNLSLGDQILFDTIIHETMVRVIKIFNMIYKTTKSIMLREGPKTDCFNHNGGN